MVSSTVEAEKKGGGHNYQISIPIQVILEAMNHPQPPTPINNDNDIATGFFITKSIKRYKHIEIFNIIDS